MLFHFGGPVLADALGMAALASGAFGYAFGMRGFVRVRRTSPRKVPQEIIARINDLLRNTPDTKGARVV